MFSIVIIRFRQSYKYRPPGATQDEYEEAEQGRTLTLGALLHPDIFPDRENRRIQLSAPWLSLSASQAVLLSIASGVRSSCTSCVRTRRAGCGKFTRLANSHSPRININPAMTEGRVTLKTFLEFGDSIASTTYNICSTALHFSGHRNARTRSRRPLASSPVASSSTYQCFEFSSNRQL
jgi:hypothetical protein